MRRADRLLRIIQILRRHRRPVKGQSMAEELEVSLRTLYRDIADLVTDGVPIRGEAGVGYVLGQGYDLPPLMFSTDEVEAVMLGLRWVMRRGDKDLVRAAHDAVAKVGAVLPAELRPVLFDTGLIVPPSWRAFPDSVDVAALRGAIREQRKVRLSYRNEEGVASERTIWPFAISYFDAQRLIVSWCELRQGFRTFRTDRMLTAEILPEKYKERRAALLKRWSEERDHSGLANLDEAVK
ncbi:MAG: YafY family transcriptional regulator [Phyllobacteriaceae bacterium]|jgi:predicted DNA-binding transcriptional regulator YafY|nr:YafY family transcriptional regulator [Phyllobacteriaceae bacterium]